VAARSTAFLFASLKVNRHLRSASQFHRRLVVRLLLLLTRECPRIERWEDLVDSDDQPRVRQMLTTTEFKKLQKQLAGHTRMDREMSISRQTSFLTSRRSSKGDGKPDLTHGDGSHSVLQQFPAFYSIRHHQLLPPKGALFDVEPHRLTYMFRTDQEKGLHGDEIEERQKMYGKNELPPPHTASFLSLLWDQLKDFIIMVLMAAAVVSLAIEDWEAAGVLFFVVLVNVAIGLVQEYRSHNALKALNSFAIPQAQVIRSGTQSVIPASELVPGDIVVLEEGANIPADLRLLSVSQLSTIEAILTVSHSDTKAGRQQDRCFRGNLPSSMERWILMCCAIWCCVVVLCVRVNLCPC
jgi:magnesium-transporting ATPase (P-type)